MALRSDSVMVTMADSTPNRDVPFYNGPQPDGTIDVVVRVNLRIDDLVGVQSKYVFGPAAPGRGEELGPLVPDDHHATVWAVGNVVRRADWAVEGIRCGEVKVFYDGTMMGFPDPEAG